MPQLQLAPLDQARPRPADEPSARPSQALSQAPSRADVHQLLAPFARASSLQGYLSFAIDIALYTLGIAGVLLLDSIAGKVAGALLAGLGLVSMGSLSHEAAHRAVVRSRFGNQLISLVTFTAILFNYRLWIYDHHVLHHARTNVKANNFLSPLTLAEFRALPPLRRALYRAYHAPAGLGILLYYLLERWPSVHFYPGRWLPARFRASAWRYTALMAVYAAALLAVLATVASARGESVAVAVLLGFVVPYTIWFHVFSMTAFLQHTNPRLRWYREVAGVASSPEALSVQVIVPGWLNHITHYVLEHPVHHVSAMIPHYRLKRAQAALAGISAMPIIAMRYTFGNMADVLRRCRLYDYEEHVWRNFAGDVTAIPDQTRRLREAADQVLPPDAGEAPDSPGIFFPQGRDEADGPAAATTTPAAADEHVSR